ncbi:xaa-Pro dipeptidase-like [Teleopsis dalmanni]|uniref:xaa-Pro dipeptidase-like n=1 Tax=Teleopsis dalmanni TaxID=139649 RepID=UPI0018CCCCB8|nr:xaa-Pro dipeptidase-like [Teleopsis dalmanni]
MASFRMGLKAHSVPMSLFRNNRQKLAAALREHSNITANTSYVLLEGGREVSFNDTDVNYLFRQESYFQYLFGVKEPDCYGVLHVASGKATLFVPRLAEEYATWMGRLLTLDEFKAMYETEEVFYVDELSSFFEKAAPSLILTLSGTNSDSGLTSKPAHFPGIDKFKTNKDLLHPIIAECRVIKSAEEIEVLRYVARVSSNAHINVMRFMRPGKSEYEGESVFLHHCYAIGGCRHTSYTCICGSGVNSAILHYGHAAAPNDRGTVDGDMCLFDMGANYCGFAADITCSFPVNGKFTEDQKFIYNAVLAARDAVLNEAREGVCWVDMHKLANRVMLEKLKEGGMLKGNVDDMLAAGLAGTFQPHGLGHLLGLDVHDVGGYLEGQPKRPTEPWLKCLRFARILKAGMYLTVEPGCYFIDWLMDRALAEPELNKFLNVEVFERFRNFGGVRIEDDVLITKDGCENFAIVPRTVQDIENVMTTRIDD